MSHSVTPDVRVSPDHHDHGHTDPRPTRADFTRTFDRPYHALLDGGERDGVLAAVIRWIDQHV